MIAHNRPFPLWLLAAGFLFAFGYWPTLAAPFDFMDDGNLVYPTPGLTARGHVELWWDKVAANVEHLGPFRPVVWAHWQLQANLFGADPLAWREELRDLPATDVDKIMSTNMFELVGLEAPRVGAR